VPVASSMPPMRVSQGPAALQPIVAAAVHLEQHALLREPLTPSPMPGRTSPARCPDALAQQDAPHAGPGQVQAVAFGEQFRQVRVVGPVIGPQSQRHDRLPHLGTEGTRRGAPAVAVSEGSDAVVPEGRQQPSHVAHRNAHQVRRLRAGEGPALHFVEDHDPLLLFAVQRDCLHG